MTKNIRVTVDVDADDVLGDLTANEIVEHFDDNNDIDSLLDAIGIEECKRYFNLKEADSE